MGVQYMDSIYRCKSDNVISGRYAPQPFIWQWPKCVCQSSKNVHKKSKKSAYLNIQHNQQASLLLQEFPIDHHQQTSKSNLYKMILCGGEKVFFFNIWICKFLEFAPELWKGIVDTNPTKVWHFNQIIWFKCHIGYCDLKFWYYWGHKYHFVYCGDLREIPNSHNL